MISPKNRMIDLSQFEVLEKLRIVQYSKFYLITNIETGKKFLAKYHTGRRDRNLLDYFFDLSRELRILSKINHPSFLKFHGYSLTDFKNNENPVIILEYPQNKTLNELLEYLPNCEISQENLNSELQSHETLNSTQKLIIIYGIAAGMSYLHSYNVIHRNLNSSIIFLDEHYYPKILRLDHSKEMNRNEEFSVEMKPKYYEKHHAPEYLLNSEFSKASDVYSFGLILYSIMTNEEPYSDIEYYELFEEVGLKKVRPTIPEKIPLCYRHLIEKCWSNEPKERPTFSEIVSQLKSNTEFLIEGINNDEYQKYIKFIEEWQSSFISDDTFDEVDSILHKLENFPKSDTLEKRLQYSNTTLYADLDEFKDTKLDYKYLGLNEISSYTRNEILNIARCTNIISQIDHPSIIKFLGFSSVDFDNKPRPIIFREARSKLSFSHPLFVIYSIAFGMSFLHSHNIIHRDLKLENIFSSPSNIPIICGFDIAKEIDGDKTEPNETIKGSPAYIAPEVYLHQGYSKASDVYSFGLLVYELIIMKKPFRGFRNPSKIKKEICENNYRPAFIHSIPRKYQELIERCWSSEIKQRPTFDEIVYELKTDPEYITDEIPIKKYRQFVQFLDEFPVKFDPNKRVKIFDDIIQSKLLTFPDISASYPLTDIYQTQEYDVPLKTDILESKDIKFLDNFKSGVNYESYKYINKKTSEIYIALRSIKPHYSFYQNEIINFTRQLNILLQLKHPAIIDFIGYDFYGTLHPLLYMSFSEKGSLDDVLYNDESLNCTQKLKIIYGIASGMSYLHLHGIIHRDLKPSNIYFDDLLHPKISGFNIAKEIDGDKTEPNETIKGSPAYIAPEVYLHQGYSKASDVYSFGLLVYELLMKEKPYKILQNPSQIKKEVCENKYRPEFSSSIPRKYQELIERCWSSEIKQRPSFDAIVYELKNDPEYITSDIDKEEFERYIDFINQSPISFNTSKRIENIEELVKFKINNFDSNDRKINFRSIYETETNNISFDLDYVDLRTFEKQKLIQKRKLFKLNEVLDKKTNKHYISKSIVKEKDKLMNALLHENNSWADDIYKMISEIELISDINHPSILNFVGYSSFDFKGRSIPVIITENASNGTLEKILEFDKNKDDDFILDDTKKLILIYGIASALSYLHSHDVIHCSLNPTNIFVDDFLFPKITGFYGSKKHSKNCNRDSEEYYRIPTELSFDDLIHLNTYYIKIDYDIYKSPMMYFSKKNSTLDDVYAFGMIVYRLIAGEIPFPGDQKKVESLIDKIYTKQLRPSFIHPIPECFKNLIEKCWRKNPDEVPTFDEIVYHLRTNQDFITDKVNKEEFLNYVNFIDKSQNSFGNQNKRIDDFIQTQNQNFRKIKINFSKLINWKKMPYSVDVGTININDFQKQTKIGSGGFGSVYKVIDKKKNTIYAAKISIYQIDQCSEDMIVNLSREVDIISSLCHPCICQFIGYSPNNFKNVSKPVIITEFVPNGSLDNFIEMERNGIGHPDWDDTKKLINIFGIASGIKYLHDHDIIHRDLKPANILIDEMLYPKIADFGLSKKIPSEKHETDDKIVSSGFKGTYAYCAPEIVQCNEYSFKSDVYAFGIMVYEILTSKILYEGFNQFSIILEISNGLSLEFDQSIPYCYRKLINKCCSYDKQERPHFSEIVRDLKTDPRFITKNVNEEDFLNYVSLIEETQNDESSKLQNIKKVTFIDHIHETENVSDKEFLDLSKYERGPIIYKGHEFKIYQVHDKEKKEFLIAQVSMMNAIKKIPENVMNDLIREIKTLKQINHSSIMRFIGFSTVDFKNDLKPVTVMESFANGTLEDILEIRRNGVTIPEWNSTKKLINIYGIAAGMSYLHSHNVVHRCLCPLSIYLDDSLLPKIGNFGLSTRFFGSDSMTHQSITGLKGSPIYYAPEIIQSNEYTKKSDVYAFSFILYEILMEEKPFHEISNVNNIFTKVVIDKKRPIIKDTIPKTYRNLIEKCWANDPSERPTFDDIVNILKMDSNFIDKDFIKEDFRNYINIIDEQTLHQTHKVNECSSKIIEEDEENQLPLTILHHQQEAEKGNVESQEFLAIKYSKENDTERTYKYFSMLIKNGRCNVPLEYAVQLYKDKHYVQAFNYFCLMSKVNHPIAQYFIGEMKFYGRGCIENRDESYNILKHLSYNGIDRATEFLEYHFE